MTKTVLIIGGSGKIGSHAADAFWNADWAVHRYDRKTDMTQAAMEADVIVNGLNPPNYHNWAKTIPKITAQVIAAAKASGATVILPGNIYNFGDRTGVLDENTPHIPNSRKGQIRVEMERTYRAAGIQTVILRAGNFIDPNGNGDLMSLLTMREIKKGKLTTAGDPSAIQAYAYVPDWARAAVMLAEKRAALTQWEDVPFPGHSFTNLQLLECLQKATGKAIRISHFPWWMMTLASPVWELAREMLEMRYQYGMSHQLGASKFERLLPEFRPTDLEQVMLCGLPSDIHPNKVMRPGNQSLVGG